MHTHIYTTILRIHPPQTLPTWWLFPSTGKSEISFSAMCCFLVWERSNCFPSWGKGNGVSITSAPPVSFWMLLSIPFLPLLPLFFLSVSPLSILPICYPFRADICCQLALLFCSSKVWLRLLFSFLRSISLSVFCVSFLHWLSPTQRMV